MGVKVRKCMSSRKALQLMLVRRTLKT
uniref:Uncharacterized protein n=1 Tax=Anguilla anguilla TaxID=7936 RepID=A0A0E9XJ08_ANGAN